uniref:MCE family protein n=1 Tax=Leptospirillum ferriphilum TaxID=178606 RepID=A0A7C3LWV3_9BACT
MKLHYVHRTNEKKLERIAAFFLLIPLLALIFGLYEVAVNQHTFDRRYSIYTVLDQSYGISPGVPVKLAGITIGSVESVDFTKLNQIKVVMRLLSKYQNKIRKDSFVTVKKSGIISGDVTLRISLGSPWLPVILSGHKIRSETPLTLEQIMAKLNPTIIKLQQIVSNISDLTDAIDRGKGTVGSLLRKQEVYDDIRDAAGNIRNTTEKIRQSSDRIPKIVDDIQSSMHDIKNATPKLPPITDKALNLLEDTKKIVSNTDNIIEGLQQSWPIRNLISIPPPLPSMGDPSRSPLPYPSSESLPEGN